jgi:hypothetical protein
MSQRSRNKGATSHTSPATHAARHDAAHGQMKGQQSPNAPPTARTTPVVSEEGHGGAVMKPQPPIAGESRAGAGGVALLPAKTAVIGNPVIKAIMRGDIEAPAGSKDMGGWQSAVFTPEQQMRLNVDAQGSKRVAAAALSKTPDTTLTATASHPLSDNWTSACSSFSLQSYHLNTASGAVSLTSPSKKLAGHVSDDDSKAALVAAVKLAPASPSVTEKQQQQPKQPDQQKQYQAGNVAGETSDAPHDAEVAWPPRDAEPEVTSPCNQHRMPMHRCNTHAQWDIHESKSFSRHQQHHQHHPYPQHHHFWQHQRVNHQLQHPPHNFPHHQGQAHHFTAAACPRSVEPITITSPFATFEFVPGIDFNTFSLMSGTKNASASF